MKPGRCRGCGAPIVFAIDPSNGAELVLDSRRHPIYTVAADPATAATAAQTVFVATKVPGALVSHFVTCPKRGQFSQQRKDGPA